MVAVKNLLCILNRNCLLTLDAEGVVEAGVKICAEHCSFCRAKGSLCKLRKLLVELFLNFLGHLCLGNSLVIFLKLVIVLKLAKLGLQRLYLLTKEVILLIFVNLLTDRLLNISLALEDHELLAKSQEKLLKSCSRCDGVKDGLLVLVIDEGRGGYEVGKVTGGSDCLGSKAHLLVKGGMHADHLSENTVRLMHEGIKLA